MKPKRKIISLSLLLLTAFLYIVALLCRFSAYVSPGQGAAWVLLGLATPAVLALNLAAMAGWLVARRWLAALLPMAAIVANWGYIASMVRMPHTPAETHANDLRIATLNCYQFRLDGDAATNIRRTAELAGSQAVDILCMQEFAPSTSSRTDGIRPALARLGLRHMVHEGEGAVASRYPIVAHRYIRFPDSGNDCLRADIRIGDDTLRIFSVHLQTTGLHQLHPGDAARRRLPFLREAVGTLARNAARRAGQTDTLNAAIAASPYPVVVAGDFNDTPASFVYRQLRQQLDDGFRQAGSGYAGTFRYIGASVRIDFILHDRRFESVDYRTLPDRISDHRMVVSALRRRSGTEKSQPERADPTEN